MSSDDIAVDLVKYENQLHKYDELQEEIEPDDMPQEVRSLLERYYPSSDLPTLRREEVLEILQRIRTPGLMTRSSLPLTCVGEGDDDIEPCPYVPGCPLVSAGRAPIGKICPFEQQTVDQLFTHYMHDLDVAATNLVEMGQVKDLVLIDLLMQRTSGTLARHGLVDINPVGAVSVKGAPFDAPEHEILYRRDPSAAADILDKLMLRKTSILRALMATREMKARFKREDEPQDTASLIARLREAKAKSRDNNGESDK
jgi:hypothetical protein